MESRIAAIPHEDLPGGKPETTAGEARGIPGRSIRPR
jgi:hypothetical protein